MTTSGSLITGNCRCTAALMVVSLLAACGLSPQQVPIAPVLEIPVRNLGRGRAIAVQVTDARARKHLGTRGGIYSDTALLTPAGDLATAIRDALGQALRKEGFRVVGAEAPLGIRVSVDDLSYAPVQGTVIKQVQTGIDFRVTLRDALRSIATKVSFSSTQDVIGAPSPEDNERLINRTISKGLTRMLNDHEVVEFLRAQ